MHRQALALHRKRKQLREPWITDDLVYTGDSRVEPRITLTRYNTTGAETKPVTDPDALPAEFRADTVNWVAVSGYTDTQLLARTGKAFGMHRLDIQDILTTQHIAKIEVYDETTLFLISVFSLPEGKNEPLQQEHLGFLLGRQFVASFQETDSPIFANLKRAIDTENARIRAREADYLFCQLVNTALGSYIAIVARLEEQLSQLEDELIEREIADDFVKRLQTNRHLYEILKKSILPLKEDFKQLLYNENELVKEETLIYLNDLEDRLSFIIQSLEICHENIASLQELYFSNNDLRMNEIMKRLTVVATIFIPLTFVVGVWGMNFRFMPELEWRYGYFIAWSILGLTALACWLFIKKRKWY